jgi:UDP-galactopyranose mutase
MPFDIIIVGAGLSGLVLAERFSSVLQKRVLVLEKRDHIGGNCFDYRDGNGILVHKYGPHLFHTSNQAVWEYLSKFTRWHQYEHKVLSSVDDKLVPLPFNLNTLYDLYDLREAEEIEGLLLNKYGYGARVSILQLRRESQPLLKELAEFIFNKFFVNYTTKQWGCRVEDISDEVIERVPVVLSRDDRYFDDIYQGIPTNGYTAMFKALASSPLITVKYGVDALTRLRLQGNKVLFDGRKFPGLIFFTGQIDSLFDYSDGELEYRSLQFVFEEHNKPSFQPVATVNYPNDYDFTRITEFKNILPAATSRTTIVKEFPQDYDRFDDMKNIPYYPVFTHKNKELFELYNRKLSNISNIVPVGRLAQYRYFDMDDAVANALLTFDQFRSA